METLSMKAVAAFQDQPTYQRTSQRVERHGGILLPLILGAVAILLVTAGGLFYYAQNNKPLTPEQKISISADLLLKEQRWDVPLAVAEELASQKKTLPEELQDTIDYLQAASRILQIRENRELPDAKNLLLKSSRKLAAVEKVGFPLGHKELGAYLLAWSHFNTRQWTPAIGAIQHAIELCPERRAELMEMLIQVHLNQSVPEFEKAHELIKNWLTIPSLSKESIRHINLLDAEIYFRDQKILLAQKMANAIPEDSIHYPEAQVLRGRILITKGIKKLQTEGLETGSNDQLDEALRLFRNLFLQGAHEENIKRQASYFAGCILRINGTNKEALGTLSAIRQGSPKTPEAIAAGIEEAELLLSSGEPEKAIETLEDVARDCTIAGEFEQQYVTRHDYQMRLFSIADKLKAAKDFKNLVRMGKSLSELISPSEAVKVEAEGYKAWALDLEERLKQPGGVLDPLEKMPQEIWKLAGKTYAELANLELIAPNYAEIAWEAALSFRYAEDLPRSNEWLQKFLKSARRELQPTGLYQLASNYFDLGELDKAVFPMETMLRDYVGHPMAYSGRLLGARIFSERGDLSRSAELLTQNLYDGDLSPESDVWRESLLELGGLLYREADLARLQATSDPQPWKDVNDPRAKVLRESFESMMDSADRLRESVVRYREDSRSLQSQYLAGRAFMEAAKWPQTMIASGWITLESQRRQLAQQSRDLLQNGLTEFRDLKLRLNERQERESLTPLQMGLLRSAYFGEADCLFQLEKYEDAINAYRSTAGRFLNRPEALEALVQISICQQKLQKTDEARRTLLQAEQVLSRIPPELDKDFSKRTRYDRQQWKDALAWMKTW
jgi:tetratricopeptide (TPR) repeat protein